MSADDDDVSGVSRGPRIPAISLEDAVGKVQAIYAADKTAGSPVEAAVRHMGYKSRSGPANGALAAIRRFGLVDSRGGRVIPTNRAIAIIRLPESDARRKAALKEAVLAPDIYKELYERYEATGLPSAESLEHELVMDGRFNHNRISAVVKDFFESLKFAGLTDGSGVILESGGEEHDHADEDDDDDQKKKPRGDEPKGGKTMSAEAPPGIQNVTVRDFPIPLMSGGIAVVKVPVPMSELDFKQLTGTLQAWKAALVRPDPPTPPSEPQG